MSLSCMRYLSAYRTHAWYDALATVLCVAIVFKRQDVFLQTFDEGPRFAGIVNDRNEKRTQKDQPVSVATCYDTVEYRTRDCTACIYLEVSHTRDQNHVTAVRDSILEVKLCHSYSGSGRYVMETSCYSS